MIKEIGGFFEKADYSINKDNSYFSFLKRNINGKGYNFYLDGRSAIFDLIRKLGVKDYLLPSYLCDSIIKSFDNIGYKYNFYSIFEKEELLLKKNKTIFIINYFGEDFINKEYLLELLENNIVIVDISHDIFNKELLGITHNNLYIVASLRKILPLYGGGIIVGKDFNYSNKVISIDKNFLIASTLKKEYLEGKNVEKKLFLEIYGELEKNKDKFILGTGIYKEDLYFLNNIDALELLQKRKRNFKYLYELLEGKGYKKYLYQKNMENYSYLVLKFSNFIERDKARKNLIDNNIFPPIHWNLGFLDSNNFNLEISLSKKIFSIPIDHRYGEGEMDYIFNILKVILGKK